MPKKIDDLRGKILRHTRTILLMQGSERLTVRQVAASCHVAVGTVYNYFPSKDIMVASVMAEDWEQTLEQMHTDCEQAENCLKGLEIVYEGIRSFSKTFSPTWESYNPQMNTPGLNRDRHLQLVMQLMDTVQPLLERFDRDRLPHLARFLAETVLSAASDGSVPFAELIPIFQRLLGA